ncbi:E3 ubiquitin-protein ligase RNF180 isoform X2 [Gasterosteus aculeatus]
MERSMLRCRRCRKGVLDSSCLSMVEATDESSSAVCSIWHVNIDTLPEWILTSVHTAQWTVGKLNCHNCAGRLGGFNFVNRSLCPCGLDATVHLSKSRVDRDHKRCVLIVRPRRTRPAKERPGPLADGSRTSEPGTELNGSQPGGAAVVSHISSVEASNSPPDATQSFSLSPPLCDSHSRRRCSVDEDSAARPSCFRPAGLAVGSAVERASRRARESTESPVLCPAGQQVDGDGEAPVSGVLCRSFVSGRTCSQLLQTVEDVESSSSPEAAEVHEEASISALLHGGGSISDSEDVLPRGFMAPAASSRPSKREKNRLKSLRRKQRRRERWLHSRLEQPESASAPQSDSEEEEEEGEDSEGLTCAVCLEVYFSPYRCQPCGHVFCEPCLRTIAKNRPTNTPCPLCRTLISHAAFHKELNQTAAAFFPKVYCARKRNFQNASCAKWSLPSCRKRFRSFWDGHFPSLSAGEQRQAAGRRWHLFHGGFADFTDVRGWLFYIGLVIVHIHSVNWILALLFLFCLLYYYLF